MKLSDYLIEVQKGKNINYIFSALRGCKVVTRQKMDEIKFYLDMKEYQKPVLVKFTDEELTEMIFAGASCPNCYNGSYTVTNSGNCVQGCGAPSSAGNFNCTYCYNNSGNDAVIKHIGLDLFAQMLDSACLLHGKEVAISGGEPLLNAEWAEMLEETAKKGLKARFITNGSLITREIIRRWKDSYPIIQVTLDSHIQAINDKYKGTGSFALIQSGLDKLRKYYDMERVILRCNLTYENMSGNHINEFVRFLADKEIRNIYYSLINCEGRAQKCIYPNRHMDMDMLINLENNIHNLNQELSDKNINIITPVTGVCYACPYACPELYKGSYNLYISYNGDVFPCQALSGKEFCLGNISNDQLEDVFLGEGRAAFLEKAHNRLNRIEDCKTCFFRKVCGKGCIAECVQTNGFYRTDGNCRYRMGEIKDLIQRSFVAQKYMQRG